MTTALYVTTKQFCKRAWLGAFIAVGVLLLGPLAFMLLSRVLAVSIGHLAENLRSYYFAYQLISLVCFLAVGLHALTGCQQLCRGLPISSRAIASWMMLAMVGLLVVLQLVTNGAYRLLFFEKATLTHDWPILGPLLFMITLTLVGNFIYWSLKAPSFSRVLFSVGLIGGLFAWFLSRYYPHGFQKPFVMWEQVGLGEFVTLQLVCLGAWYQGTREFARFRAGTTAPSETWFRVEQLWSSLISGSDSRRLLLPLSSRMALAKFHWRHSGQLAVIMGGVVLGLAALMINLESTISFDYHSPGINDYPELIESFYGMTLLFSWIAAIFMAALSTRGMNTQGRTGMNSFLAKAPLSDRDLNTTLTRNVVKLYVTGFLLFQASLLLSYLALCLIHGAEGRHPELKTIFWVRLCVNYTLIMLVGFWIIGANLVSILWTGRTWFYWTMLSLLSAGFLSLVGLMIFLNRMISTFVYFHYCEIAVVLLLSLLVLSGTVFAFRSARKKTLIGHKTPWIALVGWLLCTSFAWYYLYSDQVFMYTDRIVMERLVELVFLGAVLSLVVLPFATIPLAVSWNRHR
ncbi:hypothetical protein Enr10x_57190 [Gimesia panareensis]|uniref:Uncharacterized protein n=1 Tax=Gimesia panareensis TaxID=2527978 RepID=A0A517QFE2_9PLAN|nr:hypothetical protein [Gimesia panareensis]QDT30353.1 hypothetical protein Enr10x_57190 [Gimesia panareensis]